MEQSTDQRIDTELTLIRAWIKYDNDGSVEINNKLPVVYSIVLSNEELYIGWRFADKTAKTGDTFVSHGRIGILLSVVTDSESTA